MKVILDRETAKAYLNDEHVFTAPLIDGLYRLKVKNNANLSTANVISASNSTPEIKDGTELRSVGMWHQRHLLT